MNTMGIGSATTTVTAGSISRSRHRRQLALDNKGRHLHSTSSETGMSVPQQETGRPLVTWGMLFGDFKLDGWEDLDAAAGDLSVEGSTSDPVTQENQTLVRRCTQLVSRPVCGQRRRRLAHSRGVSAADYDLRPGRSLRRLPIARRAPIRTSSGT